MSQQSELIISGCLEVIQTQYLLVKTTNESSYEDARSTCEFFNASFATLNTETKFEMAKAFIDTNDAQPFPDSVDVFIGLTKPEVVTPQSPLGYLWEDGTEIKDGDFASTSSRFPWNSGEPSSSSGSTQQCTVLIGDEHLFNDRSCTGLDGNNKALLCEIKCGSNDEDEDEDEDMNDNSSKDKTNILSISIIFSLLTVATLVLMKLLYSFSQNRKLLKKLQQDLINNTVSSSQSTSS